VRSACLTLLLLTLTACQPSAPESNADLLQGLRGQWVVINYWAEWCKPCIKEIPELNALDSDYESVTVLGVNYDGATGDALQAQLDALQVQFATLGEDPAGLLGLDRPNVLPTTLIINPAGELLDTLVGPQTLESLLAVTVHRASQAEK
jgi:thiol-disulfide isomerase/thioredoxin